MTEGVNRLGPSGRRQNPSIALSVGLVLAISGFWLVVDSVPKFQKFAIRQWGEVRTASPSRATPLPDGRYLVTFSGFDAGGTAMFGAVLFALGTGIAASPFLDAEGRRWLSLALALSWHAVGLTTAICFLILAPRPLSFEPLLTIGVFEWLGLLPLALGTSKDWWRGRLKSAIWNVWAGAVPGGLLGGVIGAATDFVRFVILKHSTMNGFAVQAWIVGILIGGAANRNSASSASSSARRRARTDRSPSALACNRQMIRRIR